jgi:hypothetical protein
MHIGLSHRGGLPLMQRFSPLSQVSTLAILVHWFGTVTSPIIPSVGSLAGPVLIKYPLVPMRRVDHRLVRLHVDRGARHVVPRPLGRAEDAQPQAHAAFERDDFADDLVRRVEGEVRIAGRGSVSE